MAFIGYFESFLILFFFSFFAFLNYLRNHKGIPRNWPLVGMLLELCLHIHRVNDRVIEILEKTQCTFFFNGPWFANLDILVTCDPANVQHIMSTNFSNYLKGPEFKKIFDILGDGFFNAESESWRYQRKIAQTLIADKGFYKFLLRILREKLEHAMFPVLENASKNGLVCDLQDLFQRFGNDITWMFVTGYDPQSLSIKLPEVELLKAVDDAEEAIFHRHLRPESFRRFQKWLGMGQEKKLSEAWKTIDKFIEEYLSSKRENLRKESHDGEEEAAASDLLTSYMKEENARGGKQDDKFLRDTVLNFLIAGRESISSSLNWFFWLVSTNPSVETKIREELKTIAPNKEAQKWRLFDVDVLNKLVYLHAALCETLRLYPPVPFQHKAPVEADMLPSGHRVTPNTKIVLSRYAMGRMRSIWGQDCHEFKPERWITELGTIKQESSYKFFTFNAGPRICPGKEMSFIQLKAVAASIMCNYDFQVLEGHKVVPSTSVILHMKYGLMTKVSNRQ